MKQAPYLIIHYSCKNLLLSRKGGVTCTKPAQREGPACNAGFRVKKIISFTALGFAASRGVCIAEMKWPIPHIQKSLIAALLYWAAMCMHVARFTWTIFHMDKAFYPPRLPLVRCVLFTAPSLQRCGAKSTGYSGTYYIAPVVTKSSQQLNTFLSVQRLEQFV